jgi:adenylosuccinate synthase
MFLLQSKRSIQIKMKVDVLLGLQWGDEGKGKIVDVLTPQYDIIARFQGGPNAGHTLEFEGIKHVLHTIPSGIFHPEVTNIIGNGVVIDPVVFQKEIEKLSPFSMDIRKNLIISKKAHLILPTHRLIDAASEAAKGTNKIGSTLKGIGPTYMDKTGRNGLRVGDIFSPKFQEKYNQLVEKHLGILQHHEGFEYDLASIEKPFFEGIELIRSFTCIDSEQYLNAALKSGQKILAEGAQGTMLDIDFGTYPFVTSSNTVTAGTCTGLGVAPTKIGSVIGIFKAYCTRVGSGPFPTELFCEDGENIRKEGNEFGSTTGRPRRCGWIDLPALKYAIMINGVTELAMMKADVLGIFESIKVCIHYEINGELVDILPFDIDGLEIKPIYTELKGWNCDLTQLDNIDSAPQALKEYITYLEKELEVPITTVSVGPDRKQTLSNRK